MPGMQDLADHNALTAMGAQHTSGPWRLDKDDLLILGPLGVRGVIAEVQSHNEAGAPARVGWSGNGARAKSDAAIAKATGSA